MAAALPVASRPGGNRALHAAVWTAGTLLGIGGTALQAMGHRLPAFLLLTLAAVSLTTLALRTAGYGEALARNVLAGLGVGLLVAALFLGWTQPGLSTGVLLSLSAAGGQLALLALTAEPPTGGGPGWGRTFLPVAGHSLLLLGSFLVVASRPEIPLQARLSYLCGFALLVLQAFWAHRQRRVGRQGLEAWEGAFLWLLSGSLLLVALVTSLEAGQPLAWLALPELTLSVISGGTLMGLSLLAGPPRLPEGWRSQPGTPARLFADAVSFTALLNVLLLTVFLTAGWTVRPLFYLLLGWLAFAVVFEYTAVLHAIRTRSGYSVAPVPTVDLPPITVVVAARDEAEVLRASVQHNLSLDAPLGYLLVPAESSTDDTVAEARRLAREHRDRVQVVLGTGGSKAEDLNQAWPHVDTDLVMILDADETVDVRGLRLAAAHLARDERIGIVQGRKRPRGDEGGWVDALVRVERGFSTLLDQRVQSEVFDAAHFAGSGALLRYEVPEGLGGFRAVSLTEDIEFTMRLYLQARWRIVYEPRMLVEESTPVSFRSLVRQRGRWARGWGQVYAMHFPTLLARARRVGISRTAGLTWQLITAVSAPWSIFLPALALLWLTGASPLLPSTVAWALGLMILPSRLVSYLYAYRTDPQDKQAPGPVRTLRALLLAYAWIVLGWFLQLQALYLEVSGSPRTWYGTLKEQLAEGDAV